MPNNHVSHLLEELEQQAITRSKQVDFNCTLKEEDLIKVEALSELYNIPTEELVATLLHTVLLEIEQKMPYKPGKNVIRIEEGDPIYEDVGPMPRYMAIKNRLQAGTKCA